MAGYSGKPLVQKLGIKPGTTIAILNAPKGYERTLGRLPSVTRKSNARTAIDFVQFFTTEKRELERRFETLARALSPAGMLWISWPKKASGVATDLTEDVVRAQVRATGDRPINETAPAGLPGPSPSHFTRGPLRAGRMPAS